MKKIFTLLVFAVLFASCSDDDKDDTVYLDNKLIEGSWYWIQASDSTVLELKNDQAKKLIYDKYTIILKQTLEYGSYKISSDRLFLGSSKTGREYKLKENILSVIETGDIWVDYTKIK